MDRIQLLEKLKTSVLSLEEFGYLFDLPDVGDGPEIGLEDRNCTQDFLFNPDYSVQQAMLREFIGSARNIYPDVLEEIEDFSMGVFWDSLSNWTLYFLMGQAGTLDGSKDYDYLICVENFFALFNDTIVDGWEFVYADDPDEFLFKQISFFNFVEYSQRVTQRLSEISEMHLGINGENDPYRFLNWKYTPPAQVLTILYKEDFSKMEVRSPLLSEYGLVTQILVYLRAKDLGLEGLSFESQLNIVGRR